MPHRAGFWIRVLATVIDIVLMLILAVIVMALMHLVAPTAGERALQVTVFGAWLGYTSFEVWSAATPGKLLLRLRVTEQDCSPAEFWRRVLRWSAKQFWLMASVLFALTGSALFYAVSGFSSLVMTVGCLYASSDDRLAWHDQWAHTAVCRRRRSDASVPPPPPPGAAPPPPLPLHPPPTA